MDGERYCGTVDVLDRSQWRCVMSCVRSAEFSDFIAKCLVKDPEQRSSASDLRQVILLLRDL